MVPSTKRIDVRSVGRSANILRVYDYDFVTEELTMIMIVLGKFVFYQLSSISIAEATSWRPQI